MARAETPWRATSRSAEADCTRRIMRSILGAGRSGLNKERAWHELRCPCGAEWHWYGPPAEGDFLKRLWVKHHQPHGLKVSI